MNKKCEHIKGLLVDSSYGEIDENHIVKNHLKECSECLEFYVSINDVKGLMDNLELNEDIDPVIIDEVFCEYDKKMKFKKFIIEYICFVITSISVLAAFIFLINLNFILYFLFLQIISIVLSPFIILIILKIKNINYGV
ncbi:MAG: hypothetical protein ABF289_09520 [Clostridiales bacterium]